MRSFTGIVVIATLFAVTSCTSASHPQTAVTATPTVSTTTASPSTTSPAEGNLQTKPVPAAYKRVLKAKGYPVADGVYLGNESPNPTLTAVLVGYRCQFLAFFSHGRYVGADEPPGPRCHLGIREYWGGGKVLAFLYSRFAKHDALCCPSLDPKLIIFRLRRGHIERTDH